MKSQWKQILANISEANLREANIKNSLFLRVLTMGFEGQHWVPTVEQKQECKFTKCK